MSDIIAQSENTYKFRSNIKHRASNTSTFAIWIYSILSFMWLSISIIRIVDAASGFIIALSFVTAVLFGATAGIYYRNYRMGFPEGIVDNPNLVAEDILDQIVVTHDASTISSISSYDLVAVVED